MKQIEKREDWCLSFVCSLQNGRLMGQTKKRYLCQFSSLLFILTTSSAVKNTTTSQVFSIQKAPFSTFSRFLRKAATPWANQDRHLLMVYDVKLQFFYGPTKIRKLRCLNLKLENQRHKQIKKGTTNTNQKKDTYICFMHFPIIYTFVPKKQSS